VIKVSNLLRKRRKELGTRNGTRALACYQQAVFVLAWFRDRPGLLPPRPGLRDLAGHRLPVQGRGVEVLRALAPTRHDTHAGFVQALTGPSGIPLWVSAALPGSTHDISAARHLLLPEARPNLKKVPILADSGYKGAGAGALVPVKNPRNGEFDTNTKTRYMLLRGARYQGERAFALMSQRWRAIRHVSADPAQIGDIAKPVLVLTQFEHKMIS
jgi:hypothetical protein